MWDYMNHYGWGGMGFGMLFFWGLIIVAIFLLVRRSSFDAGKSSSLEILKERYARGEIERDEFEQKKRDLEN